MYVCMYVCVSVNKCVRMCVGVLVCFYTCAHACMYVRMCAYAYVTDWLLWCLRASSMRCRREAIRSSGNPSSTTSESTFSITPTTSSTLDLGKDGGGGGGFRVVDKVVVVVVVGLEWWMRW